MNSKNSSLLFSRLGQYFVRFLTGTLLFTLCGVNIASAQNDAPSASAFEEIVVTARKREESLQDVPLAITAFTEKDIEARGMADLMDTGKFTPNFTFSSFGNGNNTHAALFMRGIGQADHFITVDAPVGIYIDGVYLGRTMGGNMDIANIDRIEILRGPQGTLFGRNTLGGALNVITKKPSGENVFRFDVKAGSMSRFDSSFYADFALSDNVFINATGGFRSRDGVGDYINMPNTSFELGDEHAEFGRVAIRWEVSDSFDLLFTGDVSVTNQAGTPVFTTPINTTGRFVTTPGYLDSLASDPDDSASTAADLIIGSSDVSGGSVTATWDFNDNLSAKLIAAVRKNEYTSGNDADRSPMILVEAPDNGDSTQKSVEFQLLGDQAWGDWVAGAYFFNEDGESNLNIRVNPTFTILAPASQEQDSVAVFGHANIHLTERLTFGGGVRWTEDDKDFLFARSNFPAPVKEKMSWSETTWNATLIFAATEDLNVYGTASTGYLSGLFNARTPSQSAAMTPVSPSFVDSYEVGFKGTISNRLRFDLVTFFAKYSDLVTPFTEPGPSGGTILENTAEAEATGIELQADLHATDNLDFQLSVGYIDTEVTSLRAGAVPGDATPNLGDRLRLTPKWTIAFAPQYTHTTKGGATVVARLDYSHRSDMFGQPNNVALERIDSRDIIDLKLTYEQRTGDWSATLYVDNVADEEYDNLILAQVNNGVAQHFRNVDRREIGIQLTKTFGF